MKFTVISVFILISGLAACILVWPALGSQGQSQSGCESFQAIAHALLPSSTPLSSQTGIFDVWGGPLSGMLGDQFVQGVLSGNDGARSSEPAIGQAKGGRYTVGLDCTTNGGAVSCNDMFTYEVANAVFTPPPGFGSYIGNSAKIIGGTGKFRFASGNLNISGPFIAWPDPKSPFRLSGRWNPQLTGHICGVQ